MSVSILAVDDETDVADPVLSALPPRGAAGPIRAAFRVFGGGCAGPARQSSGRSAIYGDAPNHMVVSKEDTLIRLDQSCPSVRPAIGTMPASHLLSLRSTEGDEY